MQDDAGPGSTKKPQSSKPITIAAVANLSVLRTRIARLSSPGFTSAPRLFFALTARDLPALAASLRHLEEIRHSLTVPRGLSLPRTLGALWLGENLVVDLVALLIDEAFAPLWSLALPGSAVVVKLRDDPVSALLRACCESAGVPLLDAKALVDPLDIGSPLHLGALIAAALGAASGA